MPTFHFLEAEHTLSVYPYLLKVGRKQLFFILFISLVFILLGIGTIFASRGENVFAGWVAIFFFGFGFLVCLIQIMWGPLLRVNEEGVQIRINPFSKKVVLSWQEIRTIVLFDQGLHGYLGFTIYSTTIPESLQHRHSWRRRIMKKRYKQLLPDVYLPQTLSPYSLRSLLAFIHDEYHMQIERYHISIEIKND